MSSETAFISDQQFSQEAFQRWLDELPRGDVNHYELINGRIVMTPPAGWPHAQVETALAWIIKDHVARRKLGVVLGSSAGFDLPSGDTIEPDLAYIAADRFAAGPQPVRGQFLRIVPTLVVEIVSPSTARRDQTEKKDVYARNGVEEYWIVDADRRTVTVFHLSGGNFDAGEAFSSGPVQSRVLPDLHAAVEEICET
jgi:Uma2 family endonuclease